MKPHLRPRQPQFLGVRGAIGWRGKPDEKVSLSVLLPSVFNTERCGLASAASPDSSARNKRFYQQDQASRVHSQVRLKALTTAEAFRNNSLSISHVSSAGPYPAQRTRYWCSRVPSGP